MERSACGYQGKVVAELMDIIALPAPRGARVFDPDRIEIRWLWLPNRLAGRSCRSRDNATALTC